MFGNLQELLSQFGNIQERMKQMQEELKKEKAEVEIGGIKVVMNGAHQLQEINIPEHLLQDKEMLEDLLITAVNRAQEEIAKKLQNKTAEVQQNLMSGLDLGDLGDMFKNLK